MKHIIHNKKEVSKTIFSLLLVITFFVSISALTHNKPVSEAEMRFTEFSQDSQVVGSMVPASCESYPSWGSPHFGGDSAGYCDCPAGGRLLAPAPGYSGIGNSATCVTDCWDGSVVQYGTACPAAPAPNANIWFQ